MKKSRFKLGARFCLKALKCLGYTALAVILFLGLSWLFTPRATLVETAPFAGEHWHNPYQGVDLTSVYNVNLHAHTDRWGMLTDGRGTTPEVLHDTYKRMGFDVIAISDYLSINRFRDTEPDYIPIYERGCNIKKTHQLIIGARRVFPFDVVLPQTTRMKQYFINKLKETGELVVLVHPKSWGGYSDEDLRQLTGYDLFEVLNRHDDVQEKAWDMVLSSGKLLYLLASDDSRDMTKWQYRVGHRFTRIFAEDTNAATILSTLRKGQHYGVAMPILPRETFEEKSERFRNLPNVTRFEMVDDVLFIQMDEPSKEVVLIGDAGIELARFSGEAEVAFDFNSLSATYVRAKIFLPNRVTYYFNPITRTPTRSHTNEKISTAEILRQRMCRIIIPEITFRPPATLIDAMDFFKQASFDYDDLDIPRDQRGISFVMRLPLSYEDKETDDPFSAREPTTGPIIHTHWGHMSLYDAVKLVCEASGMKFSLEHGFVLIEPIAEDKGVLFPFLDE